MVGYCVGVLWGIMPCMGVFNFFSKGVPCIGLILTLTLYSPIMFDVSVLRVCWYPSRDLWLWMHTMVVYWFSRWWRYFGHSGVGLYCMVLGEMVKIVRMSAWVIGRGFPLWLILMMGVALWFSWATIRAQWIDVMTDLRYGGWTKPLPPHFDKCARLCLCYVGSYSVWVLLGMWGVRSSMSV